MKTLATVKFLVKMAKKCQKCEEKCGKGKVHPDIVNELQKSYQEFQKADSKSLLKKYLTRDVFERLKTKKTSYGCSLLDCIRSGLENPDSGVGVYAADPECYTLYADLFDPIIQDYHGFRKSDTQPPKDWGELKSIANLDPKGQYVVSTRVRCGRMLEGYAFSPLLTEEKYLEIEAKLIDVFKDLSGQHKGNYYPINKMTKEEQQRLIDDHYLFKEGDRFLQSANNCRFWPNARGIYYNDNKTFLIWVNEEDHMRIISLQQGGNLPEVYNRLTTGVDQLEKKLKFMRTDHLGYLTFCPTNLGTTIRASVHIKVPKLAKDMTKLNALADRLNLQVRGTAGEHSEAVDGIYDISNKRRLGVSEAQIIQEMYKGIMQIISEERNAK